MQQDQQNEGEPVRRRQRHLANAKECEFPQFGAARAGAEQQPALEDEESPDQGAIAADRNCHEPKEHADRQRDAGVQAAESGSGSRLRSLTLADLSWPQAARMSRPRGVRTGAE